MATMAIHPVVITPLSFPILDPFRSNKIFVPIPNPRIKNPSSHKISASMAVSNSGNCSNPWLNGLEKSCNGVVNQEECKLFLGKDLIFSQSLDDWVRDSIDEIVKNLRKTPLLAHVYCKNGGVVKVVTHKGCAEDWPNLNKEWRKRRRKSPDGIILVEELKGSEEMELGIEEELENEEKGTKAWGLLIQGRERECCSRQSCYLLKTCSVDSGLGFFGTHFSLVKVTNFKESAFTQIRNSWLLQ